MAAFLGMECVSISERYGAGISDVFPAYAVARLAEMEGLDVQSNLGAGEPV